MSAIAETLFLVGLGFGLGLVVGGFVAFGIRDRGEGRL